MGGIISWRLATAVPPQPGRRLDQRTEPVSNGILEQLQADALPAGDYVIRLVVVGNDGNFVGEPYYVPIQVSH